MKYIFLFILIHISLIVSGQSITGTWDTYDDKTKEKKATIEIYETDSTYYGKIIKSYSGKENSICEKCKGTKKDKPIIGLVIIEDIKKDDDEYNGGTILDPESGKTYSCYLELTDVNTLKVRGFLGFSLLGRTQYWQRKN